MRRLIDGGSRGMIVSTARRVAIIEPFTRDPQQLLDGLKKVAADYKREKISAGYRYWFWNLTATLTLDRMIEKEAIKFRGNPYYNFGALTGK